jgi:hypothetical protein
MSLLKLEHNLTIEDGPWKLKIFMVAMDSVDRSDGVSTG